ncbi:unnamed protein product [Chrysodeixis includens]|uniref:Uncharacterized protein n=1 Tax=Chrysodeixis includens TaxID=689277 RepID=A0A9N8Q1T6_CHRIL|nr:unnamed protein product [Chrysodeixis includens]
MGCVLPSIDMITDVLALSFLPSLRLKKSRRNSASIVAEDITSFRVLRFFIIFLSSPIKTSVICVLSCTSSKTIQEYCISSGDANISLKSTPSVMNTIPVAVVLQLVLAAA